MSGEGRRDDVLLYASGVLEGPELEEVERYLAEGGPRAVGELAEAEATLSHMALSLDPLEPPSRVKSALFARVDRARPRLLQRERRSALRVRAPEGRGRPRSWLKVGLAGAAAMVLASFGTYTVLSDRVGGLEQTLVQQAASLSLLNSASASPEVKVIEMQGPALRHRGFVRMYQNWQTGDCYVFAHGLRPAKPDHAYHVWFTTMEGERVHGGRLLSDGDGVASILTRLPRDIDLGAAVVITLEPEHGSLEKPSGDLQLVGEYHL